MKNEVIIRPLQRHEIPLLEGMAPADWNSDLPAFMISHFGEPYFYPIIADMRGAIIGVANAIQNGETGWLGNIIVRPEHRNQGMGTQLTRSLVQHFAALGCRRQLLIATPLGEPIYRKLDFRMSSQYKFFKGPWLTGPTDFSTLRGIGPQDSGPILDLDRQASGEDRGRMLGKFFSGGWVHQDRSSWKVDGFFLPAFGAGLIVAANKDAGLALLRLKHSQAERTAVVPEANRDAADFLVRNGFEEYMTAPRMFLGEEADWKPQCIYARGSGYSG